MELTKFRRWAAFIAATVVLFSARVSATLKTSADVLSVHPYLVIFPKSVIPGVPLDVRVTILNATADVQVEAQLLQTISSQPKATESTNSVTIAPGDTRHVQLQIPMELPPYQKYAVYVKGAGGLTFGTGAPVKVESKGLHIITQTDKVRYSGGQQVKFRSVLLLPNLLGYTGNVTVIVYDAKHNKVQVIGPQRARNGVVDGIVTLINEPEYGVWSLVTTAHGISHTKHFKVKPYILPKFSVTIDVLPKNNGSLQIKVTARYTFNADVHGKCTVEIYDQASGYKRPYTAPIKGSVIVNVNDKDIFSISPILDNVGVRAMVTDDASSITMVAEKEHFLPSSYLAKLPTVAPYRHNDLAHIEQFDNRNTFVPGMPFYTTLSVMKKGDLIQHPTKIAVTATITTYKTSNCLLANPPYPWLEQIDTTLPQFYTDSDDTGLAPLILDTPHNAQSIQIKIMSEVSSYYDRLTLYPLAVQGTPMLRVIPEKPHAKVGSHVILNVTASEEISGTLMVEVYARGIALQTQSTAVSSTRFASVSVAVTADMVPYAHIVVTHVTASSNLMYDYSLIKVFGSALKNQVNVTFNTTTLEPGKDVEMILSADPNSTVYVLTEDLKNRLLGTDNDIYLYELDDVTTSTGYNVTISGNYRQDKRSVLPTPPVQKPGSIPYLPKYYYTGYTFMDDGIIVLPENQNILSRITYSELLNERRKYASRCGMYLPIRIYYYHYYPGGPYPSYLPGVMPNPNPNPAPGMTYAPGQFPTYVPGTALPMPNGPAPGNTVAAPVAREYFPETWIWEAFQIGQSGSFSLPLTVPDSITSWVTSVFATNEKTGFGLAVAKPKITVKKDFFVTMDPPKLIVFGEEFLLQMTVFNYLSTAQKVLVQVNTSDDPSHLMESTFNVNPGDGHSTFFQITPKHIGVMKITAVAHAGFFKNTAVDEIEKEVTVKPSGVHILRNEQHLVEVASSGQMFNKTVAMPDPPNMVPGSKTARVSITGDFMTNTIEGLEKLINMPFGCGEQTMLNFAPDIYITNYLKSVGKLTDKIRKKAMGFMESGLQRELGYRHTDGSFSAFGNSDPSGSSWLTAFVLKCFNQADGLLEIDESVKVNGLNWLLSYQHADGSFFEPGRIIHTQMQAGTGSGIKLTAFILNSILENTNHASGSRAGTAIAKASAYLEKNLPNVTDMYTLAIVCYALAKSNNPSKSECLSRLESTAVHKEDKMYWLAKTKIHNMTAVTTRDATTRAPSADIEASSYSLLTYLTLGERQKAKPVVKWLISQRNPNGGFRSTQDTIISLQALSLFASQGQQGSHVDFNVKGGSFKHAYSVTKANTDFMHTVEVPASLPELSIQATGQGNAVVDVTMSYYVDGIEDNHLLAVSSNITKESLNAITISPCIRWNGDEASGMIVAEVEMPTGFSPDDDKLKTFSVIKKHETIGQSVALYFDGISAKQEICVFVTFVRTDPVVKSQASHVTVYDYYEPTNQARTRYESGVLKSATICDVCPECSFCKPGSGIGQIGVGK